jgi:class 3 adenylate cyclase
VPTCARCRRTSEGDFAFCPHCGTQLSTAPTAQRKTVTVLFCDVVGSTALGESTDPEALQALLVGYFERMRRIVERHGGTVEKFIGDAVMAVFGIPRVHEDDALRAVRAAEEMRQALPVLGVEARIGINTGEVVTGTEERLATGDAVNVAARLEQAAESGEVLIGETTLELVRDAVAVEALAPLTAKGKARPLVAYRLGAVHDVPDRRLDEPMVGRETELAQLRGAFDRAVADCSCELFTIVGEAGVGKSRLVREFLSGLQATVAAGRCLPYGEGITYWPIVEVVKRLRVRPSDRAAGAAIASLLGEDEAVASAEEIAWAFRKTLEQAAQSQPLVVVFDDIQWGEETFLDLVEHVGLLSGGVPMLLLCMARPELTEHRPGWAVALNLAPLPESDVQTLVPKAIGAELRERIVRAAGGNPLFVEEIVVMAMDSDGEVAMPPTLRALLTARLDQLAPGERRVLECAAVEGEVVHRGAAQALAGEEGVTPRLAALVRKGLIGPDLALLAGEDGFRFRHLLIRDAAYEALTKSSRAELHGRLAGWLEEYGKDLVELDEVLGYHLEQAALYKAELGQPDAALSERAGQHLAAAGQRALWRLDERAAATLLERALELTRPIRLDVQLELQLSDVLWISEPQRRSRRPWTGTSASATSRWSLRCRSGCAARAASTFQRRTCRRSRALRDIRRSWPFFRSPPFDCDDDVRPGIQRPGLAARSDLELEEAVVEHVAVTDREEVRGRRRDDPARLTREQRLQLAPPVHAQDVSRVDVGRQVSGLKDRRDRPLPPELFDQAREMPEERPRRTEQRHHAHERSAAAPHDPQHLGEGAVGLADHVADWTAVADNRIERLVGKA